MAGNPPTDYLTIGVSRTREPFKDEEQRGRDVFARHPNKEEFLRREHKRKLKQRYQQLKALGLHPLLQHQTNEKEPLGWVHLRIEAEGTQRWIKFFMRRDNLYVRGFENEHNCYEMTEEAIVKGTQNAIRPQLLPPELNCVLLPWDLSYSQLLGTEDPDALEAEFQRIARDANFAFDAVCFLSRYVHTANSDAERVAKKMIGGLIFLLAEYWRMKMNASPAKFIDKARNWGNICIELLKWRDNNFENWISSRVYSNPEEAPKIWSKLKEMGITTEVHALELVYLMLNRTKKHYEHLHNKWLKTLKVSGKDEKGNQSMIKGTEKKGPKGLGNQSGQSMATKDCYSHNNASGKSNSTQRSSDRAGNHEKTAPVKESVLLGRRRIQLLRVSANFRIDWIDIHDWHRPQAIYRSHALDCPLAPEDDWFTLVGPKRPIGAYGSVGVEFFPTTITSSEGKEANHIVVNKKGAIMKFWDVDYNIEEPTFYCSEIDGPWVGDKLFLYYMLVPDAVEAHVEVKLLLAGEGPYLVSGSMSAQTTWMEHRTVDLFCDQVVEVSSGKWVSFPLMVSVLCVPNEDEVELMFHAYLTICHITTNLERRLTIPVELCFSFDRTVTRREREVRGDKIAVTVNMRI